jgi:hypothetical protein
MLRDEEYSALSNHHSGTKPTDTISHCIICNEKAEAFTVTEFTKAFLG